MHTNPHNSHLDDLLVPKGETGDYDTLDKAITRLEQKLKKLKEDCNVAIPKPEQEKNDSPPTKQSP